jgi:hypothetical protein
MKKNIGMLKYTKGAESCFNVHTIKKNKKLFKY